MKELRLLAFSTAPHGDYGGRGSQARVNLDLSWGWWGGVGGRGRRGFGCGCGGGGAVGVWWFAARGGARWSVSGCPGVRGRPQGRVGSSGCGQGLEASDALEQEAGPGVVGPVAQDDAAGVAGDGGGDVHQSQADRPGLPPSGAVAGQGEHLGPGEQVVGQGHDLAPDAVGGQALQGEGAQAGVLGASDAVLAPGPQPVADFEVGEPPSPRVGGQGGEPVSAHVVEAQPRAGVGFFSAHDHPHALGPSRQVQQVGDLRHVRALAGVAVGVAGRGPGGLGDLRVDLRRVVGELEPGVFNGLCKP